jgi:hypothetical protein
MPPRSWIVIPSDRPKDLLDYLDVSGHVPGRYRPRASLEPDVELSSLRAAEFRLRYSVLSPASSFERLMTGTPSFHHTPLANTARRIPVNTVRSTGLAVPKKRGRLSGKKRPQERGKDGEGPNKHRKVMNLDDSTPGNGSHNANGADNSSDKHRIHLPTTTLSQPTPHQQHQADAESRNSIVREDPTDEAIESDLSALASLPPFEFVNPLYLFGDYAVRAEWILGSMSGKGLPRQTSRFGGECPVARLTLNPVTPANDLGGKAGGYGSVVEAVREALALHLLQTPSEDED